jgi:hypothetical protein
MEQMDLSFANNINEDFKNLKDDSICDISAIEENKDEERNIDDNQINIDIKEDTIDCENKCKKRRNKEDLDKTPLPIFDCIYCSNEGVVFNHMVSEQISERYLYNCSKQDITKINVTMNNITKDINNSMSGRAALMASMIASHTEYLNGYYSLDNSISLLKHKADSSKDNLNDFNCSYIAKPVLKFKNISFSNITQTFPKSIFVIK